MGEKRMFRATSTIRCSTSATLTHEGPALKAQKEAAQIFARGKDLLRAKRAFDFQPGGAGSARPVRHRVCRHANNHKAAHHGMR